MVLAPCACAWVLVLVATISEIQAYSEKATIYGEIQRDLYAADDDTLFGGGENVTELCKQADELTQQQCYIEGNYCYFTDTTTRNITYSYTTFLGTQSSVYQCKNSSSVNYDICPSGYYCPDNITALTCPIGSYCYAGSVSPQQCPLTALACASKKTVRPSSGILFILFFVILLGGIISYGTLMHRSLFYYEKHIDETIDAEHAYSETDLRSEQEIYLNTLMFLANKTYNLESIRGEILSARAAFKTSKHGADDDIEAAVETTNKSRINSEIPINSQKFVELVNKTFQYGKVATIAYTQSKLKTFIKSKKFQQYMHFTRDQRKRAVSVNSSKGHFHFEEVLKPMFVSFDGLNMNLKKNNAPILRNIFGSVRPFNLTGLMGASGAGKSSLMALLRGQAHYASITGSIYVNGVEVDSLVPFRDQMAFVAQDDIMHDDLTVEDNIVYSAILFNKRGYKTRDKVLPMVIHVMDLLGITFIRHSVVGSPEIKGISGGQKKRVSVAMELMKEPTFFLLDEPTSGLDSATSISLLTSLHNLSDLGVNIVATLHQPRQEIFDLINNLCLLAPGGRVAYFGPAFGLRSHLFKLGYQCSPSANIADFSMDVMAGFVVPVYLKSVPAVQEIIKTICDYYQDTHYKPFLRDLESQKQRKDSTVRMLSDARCVTAIKTGQAAAVMGFVETYATLFYTCFTRQIKIYHRTWNSVVYSCMIFVVLGIIVGILFGDIAIDPDTGSSTLPAQVSSSQLVFALVLQSSSLKLFLNDSTMRIREETGGIPLSPLYLGKLFGASLEFIIFPYAYCTGYFSCVVPRGYFGSYWCLFILLHLAISGFCNFVAVFIGGKNASLIASGCLVIFWAFGGINPTKDVLIERMGNFGIFVYSISMFTPAFSMALKMELSEYTDAFNIITERYINIFGIKNFTLYSHRVHLVAYWIISNGLAFSWMQYKRDDYRLWRLFSTKSGLERVIINIENTYKWAMQFVLTVKNGMHWNKAQ